MCVIIENQENNKKEEEEEHESAWKMQITTLYSGLPKIQSPSSGKLHQKSR